MKEILVKKKDNIGKSEAQEIRWTDYILPDCMRDNQTEFEIDRTILK